MTCSNHNDNDRQSLVYLDKIFYDNTEKASPILTAFSTSIETFTQQLTIGSNSCGCGQTAQNNNNSCCNCCCDVTIGQGTTFDIDNAFVIVHSFDLVNPDSLTEADVTVDGFPITDIEARGGQYIGDLSGIMSEITKCPCKSPCANQCPGNFVMVTADGPWNLEATLVVEGTLTAGGASCPFRLCFAPVEGTPVVITGPSTFALCGVDIPCQKGRISPSLVLDFDACASLLNPVITVNNMNGSIIVTLSGSLVVTPQLGLKVIRPSLFNLSAYEVDVPCDDVGQCNPCNTCEAECFELTDNCCGCDNESGTVSQRTTSTAAGNAYQCCDTNGYGYF